MKHLLVLLSSVIVLAGCSSPEDGGGGGVGDGGQGSGADAAVGSADAAPECTELLCLDEPEQGFQLRSIGTMIAASQDVEYCELVALPGSSEDTYYVNRFESYMSAGSHHLIVNAIEVGTEPDGIAVGDRIACQGPGGFGGDTLPATGSQHPYHQESFPEGVGRVYHGGQLMVFNYHYLNTQDVAIMAQAAVNFHTVDASRVTKVADNFGFFNLGINTPPGESATFTADCAVTEDIVLHRLTRHTHRWGTDFRVWYKGGAKDGELVFETPNYEDTEHIFDEPIELKAGEGFTFECNYYNTETYPLRFGLQATDEMCILFGTFWHKDGLTVSDQDCFNQ